MTGNPVFVPPVPTATGNSPDFSAKVRWRMLHDRNPLFPILQDKIAVKHYANERGVVTPPMLFVTTDPSSLPFDQLPYSYFIKANHGCGWNFLCEADELFYFGQKSDLLDANGRLPDDAMRSPLHISRDKLLSMCREMLNMRFSKQEWAYQVISPQIFAEERLYSHDGGELQDYRFYTFNGEVRVVNVGSSSYRKKGENVFFTPDWQPIALTRYSECLPDPLPPRPPKLDEMIGAAQRLGCGIDFVRVDLYQSTQGIMLGEITLYPDGGRIQSPTACPRFNQWLGSFWEHPGHADAQWS
jgi:hypothetical protein